MNFKSLFCGLAAAAMFTACSNDEPNNGGGVTPGDGTYVDAGYLKVGINLPSVPSSRAINDNFDHGTANEYAVKNSMLVLFTGASEATATYHSAYELDLSTSADGADKDNITVSYLKSVHLNNVGDDDHLWGLVLVNYDNVATAELDGKVQIITGTMKESDVFKGLIAKLTINGNTISTTTKFADIQKYIASVKFINGNNDSFFMTNAVVATTQGENAAPTNESVYTLQDIGVAKNVTYSTEAEATAHPAASFYVERAVAKATLTYKKQNSLGGDLEKSAFVTGIKDVEWVLDNTEPTSYIIRNVVDDAYTYVPFANKGKYRFIGGNAIGQTAIQPTKTLYRHYWAVDPGYKADATLTTFITKDMLNADIPANTFKGTGSDNPQYCHENTFDVAHMNYKNSTRAVLKVTFEMPDGVTDLWVNNGTIYGSEASAWSLVETDILASGEVRDVLKAALADGASKNLQASDLEIGVAFDAKNNLKTVTSIALKNDEANYKPGANLNVNAPNLIAALNAKYHVVKYERGVAYYDIRFKHFGDDYCHWENANPGETTTYTENAYGTGQTAAEKYLGRWGMVRNNWYEINVNSIKQLGKPVIGNLYVKDDTTPDDNETIEKYLAFTVNILSWAKRVQNEDL